MLLNSCCISFQDPQVDCYKTSRVQTELCLSRENLVGLAILLGCDYIPKVCFMRPKQTTHNLCSSVMSFRRESRAWVKNKLSSWSRLLKGKRFCRGRIENKRRHEDKQSGAMMSHVLILSGSCGGKTSRRACLRESRRSFPTATYVDIQVSELWSRTSVWRPDKGRASVSNVWIQSQNYSKI